MRNSTAPIRRLLGVLLCFVAMLPVQAQETPNARQARSIFDHAYDMFYGSEGCSFNYRISILKIYSSEGTGWYKGNMKEVRILLEQNSHIPVQLRIKVSFFWANIYFTNFKAGGIDDNLFIFPKKDYPDYKIVDER